MFAVTGVTGFKGAWLSLTLTSRRDRVSGLGLAPAHDSLFEAAQVRSDLSDDRRLDIREGAPVREFLEAVRAETLFHLAAQPLVRYSYEHPEETIATNVVGTMNVLDAVRQSPSVKCQVIVTTDKVYRNVGKVEGYVESDPLGGHDPYSASKAMADLLTQSWIDSFDLPPTGIARAGNVIGGGDVSVDRLLPDLMRAFARGEVARIRNPHAVRPWQHVLDCLNGYLLLTDHLMAGGESGAWNFGPPPENAVTVGDVADLAARIWGNGASWQVEGGDHPHEAAFLTLDSTKARTQLQWRDRLNLEDAVGWVVEWHQRVLSGEGARDVTLDQVRRFNELA